MKKLLIIAVAAMAIFAMSVPAMAVSPSSYTFDMAARMLTDIGWDQQRWSRRCFFGFNGFRHVCLGSWLV